MSPISSKPRQVHLAQVTSLCSNLSDVGRLSLFLASIPMSMTDGLE